MVGRGRGWVGLKGLDMGIILASIPALSRPQGQSYSREKFCSYIFVGLQILIPQYFGNEVQVLEGVKRGRVTWQLVSRPTLDGHYSGVHGLGAKVFTDLES